MTPRRLTGADEEVAVGQVAVVHTAPPSHGGAARPRPTSPEAVDVGFAVELIGDGSGTGVGRRQRPAPPARAGRGPVGAVGLLQVQHECWRGRRRAGRGRRRTGRAPGCCRGAKARRTRRRGTRRPVPPTAIGTGTSTGSPGASTGSHLASFAPCFARPPDLRGAGPRARRPAGRSRDRCPMPPPARSGRWAKVGQPGQESRRRTRSSSTSTSSSCILGIGHGRHAIASHGRRPPGFRGRGRHSLGQGSGT